MRSHGDKEVREESWGHKPTSNGRPPWRHGTSKGQPRGRHSWCFCCCLCTSWGSPHTYLDLLLDWLCYQILSPSSQPSLSSILCHKGGEGTEAGGGVGRVIFHTPSWGKEAPTYGSHGWGGSAVFPHYHFSKGSEKAQ